MLDHMTVMTGEGPRVTTLDARTLAAMVVADADSYCGSRDVVLLVLVDADPFTGDARVVLDVDGRQRLALTAAQRHELARQLLDGGAV